MRLLPAIALAALALSACGDRSGSVTSKVSIKNPYVRLAAVSGRPAAGYFEMDATGDHGALIGVASPQAGRIEMHETMSSGTMSSMRPLARIATGGETIAFEPGGRHLMVFDVDPKVQPGGTIALSFQFEKSKPVTIQAKVLAAGDDAGH